MHSSFCAYFCRLCIASDNLGFYYGSTNFTPESESWQMSVKTDKTDKTDKRAAQTTQVFLCKRGTKTKMLLWFLVIFICYKWQVWAKLSWPFTILIVIVMSFLKISEKNHSFSDYLNKQLKLKNRQTWLVNRLMFSFLVSFVSTDNDVGSYI